MAKTNEQFDQHFREKLDGHREKPSALAWERLESQLPKQSKPKLGIWWAIAASVTALLVAGYSFWPSDTQIPEESFVAEKTETPSEVQPETLSETPILSEEIIEAEEKPEVLIKESQPAESPKTNQKTKPTTTPEVTQASQQLIAQAENKSEESPIAIVVPELKTEELQIAMPELTAPQIEKTIAQTSNSSEEEPLYRVSIYSNGIKKGEPADKNLITELGKTVGQVEGLLGKVDEGFAEIQDRKDNLFAGGISIKKDRAER
jgi:hypothetical protein